ncbi:MAG: hydroxymethylglutaryl-CoA reductase, degradative [Anaerolineae bacterium]|nr:hydroxymethylglutaryl-CoA reductase, degradative [Anaerolineae bacterium]
MTRPFTSRLNGLYNRSLEARTDIVSELCQLSHDEKETLRTALGLGLEHADHMIENTIGLYTLPMGIATNFIVNEREVLVPMVIEEPSVVAGASLAAKLARSGGGFTADADDPLMIGQIQLVNVPNPASTRQRILGTRDRLLSLANSVDPILVQLGGGAQDIEVRVLETPAGTMVIVHLIMDVRDAMGANAINTACETLAPELESLSQGQAFLRILSNYADRRLARACVKIPETSLAFGKFSGETVAKGIENAWAFASADPYRATTHNKGIMNGIDAIVVATGNDWRAVEAGAHAYAARSGHYTSLSTWQRDGNGNLTGTLELPLALGIIGGATRVHPTARTAIKILGIQSSRELAEIVVSVGLAQNLAALRALATEGIQKGHMALHARQVAIAAGAQGTDIAKIAQMMIDQGTIRGDTAQTLLQTLRESGELNRD